MTERYSRGPRKCNCAEVLGHPCIDTLRAEQAWTLYEAPKAGGIHGLEGVGSGKTISGILVPLAFPKCDNAVLLAKPTQRLHYELHWKRLYEHFFVPSLIFDDGSAGLVVTDEEVRREFLKRFNRPIPALHFFPYSRLSRPEATDWLERMRPQLVVADESHCVAGQSVRSGRLVRFFKDQNRKDAPVDLCDWSGTLVKRGICDTSHLAAFALGSGSPQPIGDDDAIALGAVVDPSRQPDYRSATAEALHKAFAPEAEGNDIFYPVAAVREGLRKRLVETLGVISTRTHAIDCALYLHKREAPPMPDAVRKVLAVMRGEAKRPDGEEIADPAEIASTTRTIALGFYNHWIFRKEDSDEKIQDWFDKRKAYHRELRTKLIHPEIHLDSPMLCYNAAERAWRVPRYDGELPVWPSEAWPDWHEVKDTIWHDSRSTWVEDDQKIPVGDWMARDAAAWATEHRGIVWCKSVAFGKRIAELAGITYHGGGPDAERLIMAEKGDKSIVVSMPAHSESRDGLQYLYYEQFICELPPSGHSWEQLLGRLARDGQKEDQIDTWVWQHVPEFRDDLKRAILLAEFIGQSTPNVQWLSLADRTFEL